MGDSGMEYSDLSSFGDEESAGDPTDLADPYGLVRPPGRHHVDEEEENSEDDNEYERDSFLVTSDEDENANRCRARPSYQDDLDSFQELSDENHSVRLNDQDGSSRLEDDDESSDSLNEDDDSVIEISPPPRTKRKLSRARSVDIEKGTHASTNIAIEDSPDEGSKPRKVPKRSIRRTVASSSSPPARISNSKSTTANTPVEPVDVVTNTIGYETLTSTSNFTNFTGFQLPVAITDITKDTKTWQSQSPPDATTDPQPVASPPRAASVSRSRPTSASSRSQMPPKHDGSVTRTLTGRNVRSPYEKPAIDSNAVARE